MSPSNQLLYFEGQTTRNVGSSLRLLVEMASCSSSLHQFLNHATDALRLEVSRLPASDRILVPAFRSTLDLIERCDEENDQGVVLSTLVLCLVQLGDYVYRAECEPGLLTKQSRIVGICTGLLPAAVAAVSPNLPELIANSCEMMVVALRVGLQAHRRAMEIETSALSWSVAMRGGQADTVQNLLDELHAIKSIPIHQHLYISSESRSSLTLSGPPNLLREFLSSSKVLENFPRSSSAELPIFAAFHAPHLPGVDTAAILDSSLHLLGRRVKDNVTLLSPHHGCPYPGHTLGEVLPDVLDDVFQNKLFHTQAIESLLPPPAESDSDISSTILILGPPGAESSMKRAVHQAGLKNVTIEPMQNLSKQQEYPPDAVAVVGFAGDIPGSQDTQGFWEVLRDGRDVHKKVPKDRFDLDLHCDSTGKTKNSTLSAWGCFLDRPSAFDHRLFNMSPREALQTDPCQRLLLMRTYEALEMSGYRRSTSDAGGERERVGSFVSLTADDWREYNASQDIDMYFVTGGFRAFAAGRLNYHFKWEGPSYTVDTACSSGAAAIQLACASLLSRDCDMAVAGGANIITGPNLYAGLSRGGFTSPTGGSKTFDESADGYCRGEAVGVLVLKRLEDAVAQGDTIRGVIRTATTNHSAYAKSITQPDSPAQQKLYKESLYKAGLTPHQIAYVEAHGTGTQAGDTKEMESIYATFAPGRTADNPLYVGSVKANVGHGEATAGITSVIKSLLMFRENTIPPHPGIKTRLNPKLPLLEDSHIVIPHSTTPFKPRGEPKRILVNNFGASGGNTCIILEEPPAPAKANAPRSLDPRSHHVVTVSAKTKGSFEGNKRRLLEYLKANPEALLQDVAYTTTSRRTHHGLRAAFPVSSVADLVDKLSREEFSALASPPPRRTTVAFIFPGQGLRFEGFGKSLYETCPPFRRIVNGLDASCTALGLPSFLQLLLDETSNAIDAGPVASQLAIVALEIALGQLLRLWGIQPSVVIGHSLGEYAALCTAGVLSVSDTLFLVGKRAEMVQTHCLRGTHGMLVVHSTADQIHALLEQHQELDCEAACFNGPSLTVVSGPAGNLDRLQEIINSNTPGVKVSRMTTDYAFHSRQMDPILDPFSQSASAVRFSKPTVPVASTVLGALVGSESTDVFSASYLAKHARDPVRFVDALRSCEDAGLIDEDSLLFEVGPGTAGLSMARSILNGPAKLLPCLKSSSTAWDTLSNISAQSYLHGLFDNWQEYNRPYETELILLDLPSYHFELTDFWIQYKGGVSALERKLEQQEAELRQLRESPEARPRPAAPTKVSSSLHRIEHQSITGQQGSITFLTDIQQQPIRRLIEGHNVIGVLLTPSGVYGEMVLMAAQHLYSQLYPEKPIPAMDLTAFTISAPLVLSQDSSSEQLVKTEVTIDRGASVATVVVSSAKEHVRCQVMFVEGGEDIWARAWAKSHYLVHDRARNLMKQADDPTSHQPGVHHLRRDMVYKLFAPVTEYSPEYWSISAAYVDDTFREAVVQVDLRRTPAGDSFSIDPVWLDAMAQAAGFMVNSNTQMPGDVLYVSTGWESQRVSTAMSAGKQYLCHARVSASSDAGPGASTLICDVTVLDDTSIVAVGEGLVFKRVKQASLRGLLTQGVASAVGQQKLPLGNNTASTERETVKPRQATGVTPLVAAPTPSGKKIKQEKASTARHSRDTRAPAILGLIAEETGTPIADLTDDCTLESLGVDSLLNVSISSRANKELGVDLPASLLMGSATIASLRAYFGPGTDSDDSTGSSASSTTGTDESEITDPGLLTPNTSDIVKTPSSGSSEEVVKELAVAMATEMGVELDQMGENTSLKELGLDSLMSISVLGIVKEKTGVELPASTLGDYDTLYEIKKALNVNQGPKKEPIPEAVYPKTSSPVLDNVHSNVVLLQGKPGPQRPNLFLISEGSGSAAAYINLPDYSSSVTVYGLESPFFHAPHEFHCTMEEICAIFARAIQSVQPHGPYLIGGWSIGGMYTYETSRQLIESGEVVKGLLLIDSACPRKLEGLPEITMDVCEETGMFAGMAKSSGLNNKNGQQRELTLKQKQHVLGCVRAVAGYDPIPIPESRRPENVFVIWSRFGLFDKLSLKVKEVGERIAEEQGLEKTGINQDWLTAERTEFGPKGWDQLAGPAECFSLEGDHFSIMMLPKIKTHTGPLLEKLITQFVQSVSRTSRQLDAPKYSSRAQDVFQEMRLSTTHSRFLKEEGCEDFWSRVYPRQRQLILAYTTEGLTKLGCAVDKMAPGQVLPRPAGVLAKHDLLLGALQDILVDGGLFERRHDGQLARTPQPVDATPSTTLHQSILRDFPLHAVSHQLLHVTGSRLAECLRGAEDPMHLIFGLNRQLAQDFYTDWPMFKAASRILSEYLRRTFGGGGAGKGQRVEVLELGAGLGGTTVFVLEMLARLGVPFRYVFTDISPSLVSAARKRFAPQVPAGSAMEFAVLDVARPPPDELRGVFDAVFASNCVHATEDLARSTGHVREMLRPEGFMALIELMPRLYFFDVVFGFFEGWWMFNDGRRHAMADLDFWEESLIKAGFDDVAWLDEREGPGRIDPQVIVAFTK